SRRRHTRFSRDWSSDVCSSDLEPTGHYWLNLAYFLDEKGIPLVMTNPMHVKRSKELDDNLPTKHDAKDALVIARLVKDGRFSYPRILKEMEAEQIGRAHV